MDFAEGGRSGDGIVDGDGGISGVCGGAISVLGQVLVGGDRHFTPRDAADGGGLLSSAIIWSE